MKKLAHKLRLYETTHTVRLFRDDLEWLLDTLALSGYTYTLRGEGYSYDSLAELIEHKGERPTYLSIYAKKEGRLLDDIDIHISGSRMTMQSDAGPDELGTLFHDLQSFPKRVSAFRVETWHMAAFAMVGSVASMSQGTGTLRFWVIFGSTLFLICTIPLYNFRLGMVMRPRHKGGFFKRKADDIWLAVISGAVGAFLGAVGTRLVTR